MKYSLRRIMKDAWALYKIGKGTFSEALKESWATAKENRKVLETAKKDAGIEEEIHTWAGWKNRGYEVIHGMTALMKTVVKDAKTKAGVRTLSYFGFSQVQAI